MQHCAEDLLYLPAPHDIEPESGIDIMVAAGSPVNYDDRTLSPSDRSHSPSLSSSTTLSRSSSSSVDLDIDMAFQKDQHDAQGMMIPVCTQSLCSQSTLVPSRPVLYSNPQGQPPVNRQSWLSLPIFAQQQESYRTNLAPSSTYAQFGTENFSLGGGGIFPATQATNASPFFNTIPSQPQQDYLNANMSYPISFNSTESTVPSIASSLSRSCSPAPITFTTRAPTKTLPSNASPNLRPSSSISLNEISRSPFAQSTANIDSLHAYGIPVTPLSATTPRSWRCAFPNCASRAVFTRGCDLRKHYNRHSKNLFCRFRDCPQSAPRAVISSSISLSSSLLGPSDSNDTTVGRYTSSAGRVPGPRTGFSSKKDRARHEAKHDPRILCEWVGEDGTRCERRFSRVDNMKDHVRRIHRKDLNQAQETSAIIPAAQEGYDTSNLEEGAEYATDETQR